MKGESPQEITKQKQREIVFVVDDSSSVSFCRRCSVYLFTLLLCYSFFILTKESSSFYHILRFEYTFSLGCHLLFDYI